MQCIRVATARIDCRLRWIRRSGAAMVSWHFVLTCDATQNQTGPSVRPDPDGSDSRTPRYRGRRVQTYRREVVRGNVWIERENVRRSRRVLAYVLS